jgi:hypothetical protein
VIKIVELGFCDKIENVILKDLECTYDIQFLTIKDIQIEQ